MNNLGFANIFFSLFPDLLFFTVFIQLSLKESIAISAAEKIPPIKIKKITINISKIKIY